MRFLAADFYYRRKAIYLKKEGNLTIFSFSDVADSLCLSVQQNFAIVE